MPAWDSELFPPPGKRLFQGPEHEDIFAVVGQQFVKQAFVTRILVLLPRDICPFSVFIRKSAFQSQRSFHGFQAPIQALLPALWAKVSMLERFVQHHAKLGTNNREIESDVTFNFVRN